MFAQVASARGDCTRAKVGAILFDDRSHEIVAVGYNGTKPGHAGCLDGACPRGQFTYEQVPLGGPYHDCIARHAEDNCLQWSRRWWRGKRWYANKTLYVTRRPCQDCLALIEKYGVNHVQFIDEDGYDRGYDL